MNIYVGFSEGKKNINMKGTIYNYSSEYSEDKKTVKIFSSKELLLKEINSLGKIYFNEKNILEKGYIDLIVDKYIINII